MQIRDGSDGADQNLFPSQLLQEFDVEYKDEMCDTFASENPVFSTAVNAPGVCIFASSVHVVDTPQAQPNALRVTLTHTQKSMTSLSL